MSIQKIISPLEKKTKCLGKEEDIQEERIYDLWHKYGNNIGVLEQASETDARARLALALLLLAPPHRDRPDIERARALLAGAQQGRVPLEDTKDAIYTQLLLRVQILLRVQMLIGALGREKSHMTAQRGRSPGA